MNDNITNLAMVDTRATVYLIEGSFNYAGARYSFWYESDMRDISDAHNITDSNGDDVDLPETIEDVVFNAAARKIADITGRHGKGGLI